MRHVVFLAAVLAACHGTDPATNNTGSGAAQTTPSTVAGSQVAAPAPDVAAAQPAPPADPPPAPATPKVEPLEGHDFTPVARELAIVGACVDAPAPAGFDPALIATHCKKIDKIQTEYADKWVKKARAFFATHVPANVPKKVVYPFSGGDLSTALTVYPDADEITTISLEPAGDPRTLAALENAANQNGEPAALTKSGKPSKIKQARKRRAAERALEKALATVRYELDFLYRVNFSNTRNMIGAMRSGQLPTQLIFGLSALKVHGYELVSLRYFTLDKDGHIHYLTDDEVAAAPDPLARVGNMRNALARNHLFANSEIRFRKPGGKIQVHRHIQQDLSDKALTKDGRVLAYLEAKGKVAGMTKAASYLLSWDSFSKMRDYLLGHVVWMVSDATGIAPKWGTPAGFEYETYGGFVRRQRRFAAGDCVRSARGGHLWRRLGRARLMRQPQGMSPSSGSWPLTTVSGDDHDVRVGHCASV